MPYQVTQIMCTHEIPLKVAKRFIPISGKWKSTNESRLVTVLKVLIPCCTWCTIYPHIVQSWSVNYYPVLDSEYNSILSINDTVECHKMQKWETLLLSVCRNYPLFVGAWKSVYKLDLLLIQDDVKVWNEPILSPVCVWCGCELKMSFCLNLPLVFIVGCGIILVRMMCVKWL